MSKEEIIQTVDFVESGHETSKEEPETSTIEGKWSEILKSASHRMLQHWKNIYQSISLNLSKESLWEDLSADGTKETSPDDLTEKEISTTTILDANNRIDALKIDPNSTKPIKSINDNKVLARKRLLRNFLLFIVSEMTLVWCSYVVGQHHGLFRYVQAQKETKYRTNID